MKRDQINFLVGCRKKSLSDWENKLEVGCKDFYWCCQLNRKMQAVTAIKIIASAHFLHPIYSRLKVHKFIIKKDTFVLLLLSFKNDFFLCSLNALIKYDNNKIFLFTPLSLCEYHI